MGRFYKINQHGPIEDYAYEMPFKELFTMQKYKREEEEKADEALKAGYDKVLNLNYKPGDEAKVAQLRKNFENLSNNVYKKYGNNLANATSSINQGISEVMDAGLMSDINANYKTWTANEAAKASLYKSGQFQPDYAVDQQGARPTEDAQGRRRDYEQYLASTEMRPDQETIYNNIPEDERTLRRLEQSAKSSAYQYAMSNPQHLIQRYGQDIEPLIQAAQMGDPAAQQELYKKSYEMLLETLPEYVSTNATDDGSDPDSDGDEAFYVQNDYTDLITAIEAGNTPSLNTQAIADMTNLSAAARTGEFVENAIQISLGGGTTPITPGVFASSNSGFIEDGGGTYTYTDSGLNPQESARQARELQALDVYYNSYKAQYEELGLRAQSTPLSEIGAVGPAGPVAPVGGVEGATGPTGPTGAEDADSDLGIIQPLRSVGEEYINPNLKRSALEELKKLGIDPDDPYALELYKAYQLRKKEQTPDDKMREVNEAMVTAMSAAGMRVDFTPEDNVKGNSFISVGPDGKAVLNVRGTATVPTTRIDNILTDESAFSPTGGGNLLGLGGKDAWDHDGDFWTQDGTGLTGPGRLFEKSALGKVGDNADGEQLYEFEMMYQIPIDYAESEHYNRANFQGTDTEALSQMEARREVWNEKNSDLIMKGFKNNIKSQTNRQVPKYVQESGRGLDKTYSLNSANFETPDLANPAEQQLNAEGIEALNTSTSKATRIFDILRDTNPSIQVYEDIYNTLADELKETKVDTSDQDAVEEYGEKVRNLQDITHYLHTGATQQSEGVKRVGTELIKQGISLLADMTEEVYNTGVVNGVIKNENTLIELTSIKAKASGLSEIKGFDHIEMGGQIYGPYTSKKGHDVLQGFNSALTSNPSVGNAILTSAYRTEAYNSTLKGSEKDSDHLTGNAFDLRDNKAARHLYSLYTKGQLPSQDKIRVFFPHTVNGVVHYHISLVTDQK
tara:strand:+ start:3828 stop:6713 length:2886 start_codon:yes stop_codon:yes gene_type:complete